MYSRRSYHPPVSQRSPLQIAVERLRSMSDETLQAERVRLDEAFRKISADGPSSFTARARARHNDAVAFARSHLAEADAELKRRSTPSSP
jgi:hypothetical protein